MVSIIRPRKDGGYSECTAPDELVGKGRCCHILGEDNSNIKLNKVQRGLYEVEIENYSSISISAQKDSIVEFFNGLGELKKEQIDNIVQFLNEE